MWIPISHVFRLAKTRWMIGRYCSATSGLPHGPFTRQQRPVLIAALTEAGIAAPIASDRSAIPARRCSRRTHRATRRYGRARRRRAERVRHSVRRSGCRAWCPAFDDAPRWHRRREPCGEHHGPIPTRSLANPGFVHLNMVLGLSTDPVLVGPHHARAELVENLKGRLVARKTKLPLKLHGGHAGPSDWRPDKRPRTRRSAECGYASIDCSKGDRQPGLLGGTCGSAGRQGGFQSGTALPPCRSAGRQSRLPTRAFSR